MYEEILRTLRACHDAEYGCSRCKYQNSLGCREKLMSKAADAIEELNKDLNFQIRAVRAEIESVKPHWIPVDERLPENPGEYLVTYHPCVWNSVTQKVRVGIDSFRGKTAWAKRKYQHVTHWMKFPEPPNNGE